MRTRILACGVLFTVAGAYPVFGQALAEGALVHANSAAATAKAGTALGNALNKATTQIGQQMHTVTQTHVAGGTIQSVPRTATAASGGNSSPAASSASSSSSGGSMIVSVKGGPPSNKVSVQPKCAPASPSAAGNNAASGTALQTQPCAAPATTQNQSKSVVTLSFPQ